MIAVPPCVDSPEALQMLKRVTHVYTDLDGTLFAPGGRLLSAHDGTPSAATAQALVALRQAGVEVIPVTGRNRIQGNEIMRILSLQTFIGELGCVMQEGFGAHASVQYVLGEWEALRLDENVADEDTGARGTTSFTPYERIMQSGAIERLIAAFPGKLENHNPYDVTREVTVMLRGFIDYSRGERILNEGSLPLRLLDNGVIRPQEHTLIDCPEIHIYHVMPRGAGKGPAVAYDMAKRGLVREQTVAVGDAIGDMAMGEHTGSYVLMNGGAPEKVLDGYHAGILRKADCDSAAGGVSDSAGSAACDSATGGTAGDFADSGLTSCVDAFGFPVFLTRGRTADGWAEFAHALLAAKNT